MQPEKPNSYNQVKWWRKSGINTFFVLVSFLTPYVHSDLIIWATSYSPVFVLIILPNLLAAESLILITCFALLTGDIYIDKKDKENNLKVWGIANKIFAVFIFLSFLWWMFWLGTSFFAAFTAGSGPGTVVELP